jgi:hypothetical protein
VLFTIEWHPHPSKNILFIEFLLPVFIISKNSSFLSDCVLCQLFFGFTEAVSSGTSEDN